MEKPGVYVPACEPFKSVTEDLTAFVHRVALNEKAKPSEIAALAAVAEVLYKYGNYGYCGVEETESREHVPHGTFGVK